MNAANTIEIVSTPTKTAPQRAPMSRPIDPDIATVESTEA